MKNLRRVLTCLLLCLAGPNLLIAQSTPVPEDPGDVFFRAYMLGNDAEKVAESGDVDRALEKFGQALTILDGLQRNHPTWQSDMVKFRRNKITDLQESAKAKKTKLDAMAAPAPAPSPTPAPTAAAIFGQPTLVPLAAVPTSAPAAGSTGDSLDDAFGAIKRAISQREAQLQEQNRQLLGKVGEYSLGYEAATKRLNEYVTAYQTLTKTNSDQQVKLAELEKSAAGSAQARAELEKARSAKAETDAQLEDAKARMTKAETAVMDQSKQLMEATEKMSALLKERDSIAKDKAAAEQDRDKLAKENAGLKASLEKTSLDAAVATKDRDSLSMEVIALKAMSGPNVPKDMLTLVAENERLKKELATAKLQVDSLRADISRKDAEIVQLKGDLTKLQGELTDLRKQNAAYETQVAELTVKIKDLNAKISDASNKKSEPEAVAENQLLRGIIMRQLRNQARQQTQNQAVIKEVQSMANASKQLIEQVEALDDNRFTLTADEQKLFTTPQLQEMLGGGEGLQATIVVQSGNTSKAGTKTGGVEATDDQAKIVADLLKKANALLQDNKLSEAIAAYQDALRADPKNIDAFLGLGWTQIQMNKFEDAEVSMRKAIAHDEKNATAHYWLAVSLFRRDRGGDAMTEFEKSLELNPKNARARHYLGVICNNMNLSQRAEKEFKSALAIDPAYGEANFNLAVLYATWDPPKWDEAKTNYNEALKKGVKPNPELEKILKSPSPPTPPKSAE